MGGASTIIWRHLLPPWQFSDTTLLAAVIVHGSTSPVSKSPFTTRVPVGPEGVVVVASVEEVAVVVGTSVEVVASEEVSVEVVGSVVDVVPSADEVSVEMAESVAEAAVVAVSVREVPVNVDI